MMCANDTASQGVAYYLSPEDWLIRPSYYNLNSNLSALLQCIFDDDD
jgi:hypothetical protein